MGAIGIGKADVRKLLEDKELVSSVIRITLEDPDAIKDLSEDVADEIANLIEENSGMRGKIVEVALGDESFRKMILGEIVDKLTR